MNMKIDSVFAVSPVGFLEIESRIFGEENVTRLGVRSVEAGYSAKPAAAQYQVAPIKLTQEVHFIYLISPAK